MRFLSKILGKKEKQGNNDRVQTTKKNPTPNRKDKEKVAVRKGEIGEYKINIQLDQLPNDYKHLEDVMVKNSKAKSGYSQIDHVVVSPYGIFVIETKNYQGTVYGGKDRKVWSVNGKFKMMNPFIQNYGHIQALQTFINKKYHSLFISMVSFTKRCTFKIEDMDLRKITSNELLVYDVELSDYISRKVAINKHQNVEPFLTEDEVLQIFDQINNVNITDPTLRKQHVETLKNGNITANTKSSTSSTEKAKCIICEKNVSEKVKAYCLSNKKFSGNIYCFEHQKNIK
ncbi:nuclease-related domain-containing protein [Gracilibacillus suaedae]|uniref:nuclease-related domain-containing protein n=1 Tax=Gracilibacillus suaedae TaxID=2820273 RepID=UPI001ABDD81E|nr:nuclease-related domain-containing protein [Gracilibacillus suaedae]